MGATKKLTVLHANDFHGQISFKLDKDYNPNWFEEAKRAYKNAEEYQQFANDKYTELLQLKDSLDFNTVGGIWVY